MRAFLRCLTVVVALVCAADAAGPDAGKVYAWYRAEGVKADGASIAEWGNAASSGAPRSLTRMAGKPQALRVNTPRGERTVVRLDGKSALWQPVSSWGTLPGARTVVAFVRLAPDAAGFLFDGSTKSGSAPAQLVAGKWETSAVASPPGRAGGWQVQTFVFAKPAGPLGGFILGANVSTNVGLACDVAEVLVYDRALGEKEIAEAGDYLREKWGSPTELPPDRQPKALSLPDDPRIFRTTLRKHGDDGVHTYRIPGLATTPKGTLIAVFDIRHTSAGDLPADIDVGMMRSTDDGATWSAMQRIADYDAGVPGSMGNGVGDPSVLVDAKTGTIFVAALWSKGARGWAGSGPGLTPEETAQFVIVKSTDDGVTWSKPVNITEQVKQPAWRMCFQGPGNGIQTRDGTLVFPAQYKGADNVPHSCFIASTDHGATWKISPAAAEKPPTSEAQIAELADGSLLLSMRNEARGGQRVWSRWEWKGGICAGKWSEPWLAVTDPTCMASLIRHPHGELILSNPNNAARRVALTVRSSADGGKSWSNGRLLDAGTAMYSCMTVLRDGRIGILYESGDAADLVFARFPIEWVLEGASSPDVPEARTETTGKFGWWPARHTEKVALSKMGGVELAFLGDSITHNWEKAGAATWEKFYAQRKAANYGFGGDSTQHVLWRIEHGEFDGIAPKAIVLMIGTNNARHGDFTPVQIADGIRAILGRLTQKCPGSKVLLLAVFPRGATADDAMRRKCGEVNALLPALADGKRVHFLDINSSFLRSDGTLAKDIMPDLLHPNAKGYELWAEAMEPKLRQLLGGK